MPGGAYISGAVKGLLWQTDHLCGHSQWGRKWSKASAGRLTATAARAQPRPVMQAILAILNWTQRHEVSVSGLANIVEKNMTTSVVRFDFCRQTET